MDTIQTSQQDVAQHMTSDTIFPGKLRGIQQLANAQGIITVTALDHRGSLKQGLQRAMPDRTIGEEREQALRSTALSRLDILNALANYRARPWYEKYPLPAVVEGWHSRYDDL